MAAEQLYTVAEICSFLRLGKSKVYALIAAGELRAVECGGIRVPDSALAAYQAALPPAKPRTRAPKQRHLAVVPPTTLDARTTGAA
jgi:excisionase family DNA binding protein